MTGHLLTEVCSDVCIEPELQPITEEVHTCATSNVQDGAGLDITVNDFWGDRCERTFLDVCVFNSHVPSNQQSSLVSCYREQEAAKKCVYEQRVWEIEHASFTPLVPSATGGMANQATAFYKWLASCLATKWDQPNFSTVSWLHCYVTFSLLCHPVHQKHSLQLWPYHQDSPC